MPKYSFLQNKTFTFFFFKPELPFKTECVPLGIDPRGHSQQGKLSSILHGINIQHPVSNPDLQVLKFYETNETAHARKFKPKTQTFLTLNTTVSVISRLCWYCVVTCWSCYFRYTDVETLHVGFNIDILTLACNVLIFALVYILLSVPKNVK